MSATTVLVRALSGDDRLQATWHGKDASAAARSADVTRLLAYAPTPLTGQKPPPVADAVLSFDGFRFDGTNEELWEGERRVALKPKALRVLRYLLEHRGRLITKREFLDGLWDGVRVDDAVLKSHLRDIREALGDDAKTPRFIETAPRRGYRFIAAVREEPASAAARPLPIVVEPRRSVEGERKRAAHFVGRALELARLEAGLEAARGGQLQTLFITGDPGIGKTTLARVFLEQLQARGGFLLARGQCIEQYGAGEAYLPLLEALERLCRGPDSAPLSVLRQSAPSWLAHVSPNETAEAIGLTRAGAPPERMLREMAEGILALGTEQPFVLLLEDLQWADHATLQLLSYLVRRDDPARVLIIGTYRSREVAQRPADVAAVLLDLAHGDRCREIALAELGAEALSNYLDIRFSGHRFPSALVTILLERTGGNPLFVSRIVDFWQERACLAFGEHGWRLVVELAELARIIPESLTRALQTEVDRLPESERRVLEAASVIGMEFSASAVAAALEMDVVLVEERCIACARKGRFIHTLGADEWPDGSVALRCAFNHGLYRHVIRDGIGAAKLSQLHRRVAARLEAGYSLQPATIAAELAMHFERGQQWAQAVRCSIGAVETSLARGAVHEAISHLTRGLELLARLPPDEQRMQRELQLQMMHGTTLAMTLGYAAPEVEQAFARSRELCASLGNRARELLPVLGGIWRFYLVRGEVRTSGELSAQALELAAAQSDPDLLLEARAMVAVNLWYIARFGEARELCEELLPALEARRPAPLIPRVEDTLVLVHSQLSWALWFLGFPERALSRADTAVAAAERLQQPFTRVFACYYRCVLLQYRKDHAALLAAAEQVIELATRHGFSLFAAMATMLKGGALAALGDLPRGLATFEHGWQAFGRSGAGIAGPSWRSLWAELLAASGRVEPAEKLLEEALALARRNQDPGWDPELHRLQGELARKTTTGRAADAARAQGLLLQALELARQQGARALELRASTSLARLLRDQGRSKEAVQLLRPLLERFEEGARTLDRLEAAQLLRELDRVEAGSPLACPGEPLGSAPGG